MSKHSTIKKREGPGFVLQLLGSDPQASSQNSLGKVSKISTVLLYFLPSWTQGGHSLEGTFQTSSKVRELLSTTEESLDLSRGGSITRMTFSGTRC